jgi:hypothetical protein
MNTVDSWIAPRGRSGRVIGGGTTTGNGGKTTAQDHRSGVTDVGRAGEHEHALALPRLDQPASDQLVVCGVGGVLREPELLLERAHRRQPAAGR